MPYKNRTCGIYSIKTPSGSTYIGSSKRIEKRFSEHKSMLRRGCHHSSRLQRAYEKYGDSLVFSVVCICEEHELVKMEQHYINHYRARLNVATDVNNVWTNPETRAKITKTTSTPEYKKRMREIHKNISTRWRVVECSNGQKYKNLTEAGEAFGVSASHIRGLIISGYRGTIKVKERFKYESDDWKYEDIPHGERLKQARARSGKNKMSVATRAKMSAAKKGKSVSQKALQAATEVSSKPVKGVSIHTGETATYPSSMAAGRVHCNGVVRTAASQINKCIKGVKKTAYGYTWEYA